MVQAGDSSVIGDLNPYPAMKDSGLEWFGDVPEHWSVRRLSNSVTARINGTWGTDPNGCDDLPCVRVADFDRERLRVRLEEPTLRSIPDRERKNRLLTSGDLLLEKSGGGELQPVGAVMMYDHDVKAVCSNFIAKMPVADDFNSRYLTFLHSHLYAIQLNVRSIKQTIGIQNLDSNSYLGENVSFPPHAEQVGIARFLDHVDCRIQRYIRAKEKVIALLKEQEQAIIHQAVTGQIDVRTGQPYPAYRDSGVAWLGRVPKTWKILPLQRITLDRCDGPFGSGLKSLHYVDEGIRVVRLQNIGHGGFNDADAAFISQEHYATLGDHSVEPGDVLIAGLGDANHPSGRACVAPKRIKPAMVKADCFRFRLNSTICDPEFIALQLTATASTAAAILSTGATRQRTNLRTTLARIVGIPSILEQTLVVEFTRARVSRINSARGTAETGIILLQEYRTRLIADVVTGKLDVREVSAALPEVDPLAGYDKVDDSLDKGGVSPFRQENQPAGVAG